MSDVMSTERAKLEELNSMEEWMRKWNPAQLNEEQKRQEEQRKELLSKLPSYSSQPMTFA